MAWRVDPFPTGIPISKRILDYVLTVPALIILSPVLSIIAVVIWLQCGWPIFFCQVRPGYRGMPFRLCKFRTMRNEHDSAGKLLPDEDRITRFGRILRALSLDELPELVHVLCGEMSLVGPRPLLTQYLDRYSQEQARRHDVLPGITGWAQVNGRNILTWPEKFRLDVWYVDHWNIALDLKILVLTIEKVIKKEGINQPGYATSPEFMGNEEQVSDESP
ncbi:MAG: sugar transferase [Anaerolineales bacterium]|nr:sugar transferase [Anaerolineales bacterium]